MTRHSRVSRAALVAGVALLSIMPASAIAHGGDDEAYNTVIVDIEPAGMPIDVRSVDGDQLRIENQGDAELVICGYVSDCEPYVRISPEGVFENRNSKAYFANLDEFEYGDVPEGAGEGAAEWKRVRRAPPFYAYHDHRAHWMSSDSLPPGVDTSDPEPQKINDFTVDLTYDGTPVVVSGYLEYVGGRTWIQRYGEYLLLVGGVLAMLVVFLVDARRRRRRRVELGPEVATVPGDEADREPISAEDIRA
ncbi:MAG: hypothetical protein JWO69_139 [Thermoleophilia bacterium]|jgi:hypothetical protein|nr:hypothetical protein [Thermoleophilia bacterium]